MASIVDAIHNPDPAGDEPRIERVGPDRQREALGLLLSGRPGLRDPAVASFLDYAREQQLGLDELWAVQQGDSMQATALVVRCPGRSGMLFCSPPSTWPDDDLVVRLIRTACRAQPAAEVRLIQSLIDPSQRRLASTLRDAGFWSLATLNYMQRRVDRRPPPTPLEQRFPDWRIISWSEAERPAFAEAILASYEDTLDCPDLRGLRDIDDIILGHQSAGTFRPDLWYAVYDNVQPVAVMLINEAPQNDACELVYLGLATSYRGQGVGRQMIDHALDTAHAQKRSHLILAVDDRNAPAERLYRSAGFRVTTTRQALVRTPNT